mgnify:FL=1|tara:strand:- start:2759 stop:2995 length:237 start_codon:yes stop_codon:yes gene_type:complete
MSSIEIKNFATDSDVCAPDNARVETINIRGQCVMGFVVQPSLVWSKYIQPVAGTKSCEAQFLGVIVEGTITCRHDDGT